MKILITNDDGYQHPGHMSLKRILEELGHEVWSIAPQENQSGASMKFSLGKNLEFRKVGTRSLACAGSPVDCVLFALHGVLPFRPDAVISGINAGANLSDDLWYSGTAAAAREAGRWGIPALALSSSGNGAATNFVDFPPLLQQHLADLLQACDLEDLDTQKSGQYVGFLNINIPNPCNGKVHLARRFEQRPYRNSLQKTGENQYRLHGDIASGVEVSCGVDSYGDARSQVSISMGSFHALQPLPYQLILAGRGPLRLGASAKAQQAIKRIVEVGVAVGGKISKN